MNFSTNFSVLLGLLFFLLSHPIFALSYRQACEDRPDLYSLKEGRCECKANQEWINPLIEGDVVWCEVITKNKVLCDIENKDGLGLQFLGGRCYCPLTQEYLTPYVERLISPQESARKLDRLDPGQFSTRLSQCKQAKDPFKSEAKFSPSARTVKIEKQIPGAQGGFLHRVDLLSPQFSYNDTRDQPAPQADPLLGHTVLRDCGSFFGFQILGKEPYLPDVSELNGAISKLNGQIQRYRSSPKHRWQGEKESLFSSLIPVRFYTVESQISEKEYLRRFWQHGEIPVGKLELGPPSSDLQVLGSQTLFVHDMGLHAPFFLLVPPFVLDYVKKQIGDLFEFEAFFGQNYPVEFREISNQYFLFRLFYLKAKELDLGSGNSISFYGDRIDAHLRKVDTLPSGQPTAKIYAIRKKGHEWLDRIFQFRRGSDLPYSRKDYFSNLKDYEVYFGLKDNAITNNAGSIEFLQKVIDQFIEKRVKEDPSFSERTLDFISIQALTTDPSLNRYEFGSIFEIFWFRQAFLAEQIELLNRQSGEL